MDLTVYRDGSEQLHYPDPRIPLYVRRGNLRTFPGQMALCHWHDDVELLLTLRGHLCYNVNGSIVPMEEGSAVFVNARQMHFGFSADGTDCEYVCITFRPQELCGNAELSSRYILPVLSAHQVPFLVLEPHADGVLLDKLRRVDTLYQEKPVGYELTALSCLLSLQADLFCRVQPYVEAAALGNEGVQTVRRMLDYIRTHYAQRVTLSQIANAGGVCRTSCCRLFQQYLTMSPNAYLNSFRLEKGMELLRGTTLSVTEIATACGYAGSSYFAECFLRAKGCTPTQYRNA